MPKQTIIESDKYELFQAKLISVAKARAGNWTQLCRDLPVSQSHMSLVKNGHSKAGPAIICRLLEYTGLLEQIERQLDASLLAIQAGAATEAQ